MAYLLGLDVGTSGVKALLVTEDGHLASSCLEEYSLASPKPGWSEQDPADLWAGAIAAIGGVLAKEGISGREIKAVGLSGQMHSSVFLDADRKVIRPAILWNDTRTAAQCREMEERVGSEQLRQIACNPALDGFTAPKVLWLRSNEPENYARLRHLVLPKDYIRYLLTGELKMEISDAAGTLLLDVRQGHWSQEICEALDLDMSILPPLVQSSEVAGFITDEIAAKTGLAPGTPVVGGGADNACGAVGSGVVKAGRAMISLGTSGVMLAHLEQPSLLERGTIHMFNSAVPQEFYMMGVVLSAGLSYRWVRDTFGGPEALVAKASNSDPYTLLGDQAQQVPPGANGLVFLPYLTGERTPHGDADARGVFFGLNPGHTKGDVVRSVLEGTAFAFRDSLTLLRAAGWQGASARIIGGGAKSPLWRSIIASTLNMAVETINVDEGPAFGAALLAGVGVGSFSTAAEAADTFVKITGTVEPDRAWVPVYEEYYGLYQDLYPALKPSYSRLAQILGR